MKSELFKTALQSYKDELAKCLQEGGEGKRVAAFLEKIDHQIPLSQHMFDVAWQHQQSKVDELQNNINLLNEALDIKEQLNQKLREREDELQKRVDAVKGLAQTLWEKSEEKHQQGKVWESKTLGECADEILDVLEQALKGGSND